MTDYSYVGVGKVHLRVAGAAAGLVHVGNVSALNFAVTEAVLELADYTQPGGGTYNEVRRVQAVEASMTLHDLSPENLAIALFGDVNAIAAGAVSDEAHTGYQGAFVPTTYPIDTAQTVTVKQGGSPNTAYTVDDDYTVTEAGIEIPSTSSIGNGSAITISYTKKAGSAVEALLNSAQEYELFFAGLNEARSGKAVTVHAYRVKLGATQNLPLIGIEAHAALELTGKVMKDSTKNGTTVSQYFKTVVVA